MSDITFTCPKCGVSLEAPSDMVGQLTNCPQCQSSIEVSSLKQLGEQEDAHYQHQHTRKNTRRDISEPGSKPATVAQLTRLRALGQPVPEGLTQQDAEDLLEEEKERREEVRDRLRDRAEDALDSFWDEFNRECMDFKKPSRAIMLKAIQYGDAQGWGDDWEGDYSGTPPWDRMNQALEAVAPELERVEPKPKKRKKSKQSNKQTGCGCLIIIGIIVLLWYWIKS